MANKNLSVVIGTTVNDLTDAFITIFSLYYDVRSQNGEIIIVIDGGDDSSFKVNQFRKKLKSSFEIENIIVIVITKSGLTKALNVGIMKASSDYIFRIDSGDIWLPSRAEYQLGILKKGYALVGSAERTDCLSDTKEIKNIFLSKNIISHSSVAFLKRHYDENYIVCQDYGLWLAIADENHPIYISNRPVCLRINTHSGISSIKSYYQIIQSFKIRRSYNAPIITNVKETLKAFIFISLSKLRYSLLKW